MIPHPIVSRRVSRAISAETTVDDRASIPCLRHQGYASASQIVSIPASSMTRADASISSSGSIVSCITPMRNGTGVAASLRFGRARRALRVRLVPLRRERADPGLGAAGAERLLHLPVERAEDVLHLL